MMQRLLSLLIFIIPATNTAFTQQSNIDIIHYKIALKVFDTTNRIEGLATISFKSSDKSAPLELDLDGQLQEKGMKVSSVLFDGKPVNYSHNNDKLIIPFISVEKSRDTSEVVIVYAGVPANGLIIDKNKFGRRTFFSDNWPDRAHFWMPCIDEPHDKATVEFIISAPAHYKVVANGILVEESKADHGYKMTLWREETRLPTKVMAVGIADFDVQLAGVVNNIPVTSWVYPENREIGFHDYALAVDILPYFINTYGPYGYKKLANVQSKTMYGGVENAGAIFYHENSITGTRKLEALLAHEIAHQWFGDMATETKFGHVWLSEGFATYMTSLYMKNKYGTDTFVVMLKKDRTAVTNFAKTNNTPVVDTTVTDYMKLLNANSYQKGSWILHMLRTSIGDSMFYRSVRKYYSTYAGSNASTDDLRKIIEEVSGKDLTAFFKQWLFTPGHPKLNIKWEYNEPEKQLNITVIQEQALPFGFPLAFKVTGTGGKSKKISVDVNKPAQTFALPIGYKPAVLIADPDTELLFEGKMNDARL